MDSITVTRISQIEDGWPNYRSDNLSLSFTLGHCLTFLFRRSCSLIPPLASSYADDLARDGLIYSSLQLSIISWKESSVVFWSHLNPFLQSIIDRCFHHSLAYAKWWKMKKEAPKIWTAPVLCLADACQPRRRRRRRRQWSGDKMLCFLAHTYR